MTGSTSLDMTGQDKIKTRNQMSHRKGNSGKGLVRKSLTHMQMIKLHTFLSRDIKLTRESTAVALAERASKELEFEIGRAHV